MKTGFYFMVMIFFNLAVTAQTTTDTVAVSEGWNLMGALNTGDVTNIISTEPPGIIESSFWGFNPAGGYYQAVILDKGYGYWVKVTQDGLILIESILDLGPCDGILTVYYEGKTYNTLVIGNQCWLRENLDAGIRIDGINNASNNGIIEKYCYNDDSVKCLIYGGLYGWDEAMQYVTTSGAQGICPAGWHIPTIDEYYALAATVSNDGNSLKAIGQGIGVGSGTNTSGMTALLTGFRQSSGGFNNLGNDTNFWSSTEASSASVNGMILASNNSNIIIAGILKGPGLCIRCLKD